MAFRLAEAFVRLTMQDREFRAGLLASERRLANFAAQADKVAAQARRMLLVGGGALAFFVKQAADAEESADRFRGVFGEMADEVDRFATTTAKAIGRSAIEIRDNLASFQNFFVGMGFGREEARGLSQQLTTLALDFASFNNIPDQEAIDAFVGAMAGADRTLRRFGVNIKEGALNQELLRQGLKGSGEAATENQKIMARVALITRALTQQGVVGDAVRDVGLFGNQMKALRAEFRDASVAIGQAFIPRLTELVTGLRQGSSSLEEWVRQNRASIVANTEMAATIAVILIALPRLVGVFRGLLTLLASTTGAIGALGVAIGALPIAGILIRLRDVRQEMEALRARTDESSEAFMRWHQLQRQVAAGPVPESVGLGAVDAADELLKVLMAQQSALQTQLNQVREGGMLWTFQFERARDLRIEVEKITADIAKIQRIRAATAQQFMGPPEPPAEELERRRDEDEARKRAIGQRIIDDLFKEIGAADEQVGREQDEIDREVETARRIKSIREERARQEKDFNRRLEVLGKSRGEQQAILLRHQLEDLIAEGAKHGKSRQEIIDAFLKDVDEMQKAQEEQEAASSRVGEFGGLQEATRQIQSDIVRGMQRSKEEDVAKLIREQIGQAKKGSDAEQRTAKAVEAIRDQGARVAVAGP